MSGNGSIAFPATAYIDRQLQIDGQTQTDDDVRFFGIKKRSKASTAM